VIGISKLEYFQRAAGWWKAVDIKAETHPGVANRNLRKVDLAGSPP